MALSNGLPLGPGRRVGLLATLRDDPQDLVVLGKPIQRFLGEHQFSVQFDLEDAAVGGDQLRLQTELLLDGVRQTGGARLVVSNLAVFNGDLHVDLRVSGHHRPRI